MQYDLPGATLSLFSVSQSSSACIIMVVVVLSKCLRHCVWMLVLCRLRMKLSVCCLVFVVCHACRG